MNRYPLWKYLLLLLVLAAGVLYALPNLYGEQPAVQVSNAEGEAATPALVQRVRSTLTDADVAPEDITLEDGRLLALYPSTEAQLRAAGVLKRQLGNDYTVALNLAPSTPDWLRAVGAEPMALGLDLRGGVHFLLEVDMETVFNETYDRYARDIPRFLRDESIRYSRASREGDSVRLQFPNAQVMDEASDALASEFDVLRFNEAPDADNTLVATLTETEQKRIADFALQQNLTTLRNRVNELGVAEPLVQRQGESRIVVELPGVQDTAEAKRLLGKTATLEYRLVAQGQDIGGEPVRRFGDRGDGAIERRLDLAQPGGHHRLQQRGLAGIEAVDVGMGHAEAPGDLRDRDMVRPAGPQQFGRGCKRLCRGVRRGGRPGSFVGRLRVFPHPAILAACRPCDQCKRRPARRQTPEVGVSTASDPMPASSI